MFRMYFSEYDQGKQAHILYMRPLTPQPLTLVRVTEINGLHSITFEPWHGISINVVCARSACAYTQTDQSLCLSLEFSMTVKLLTKQKLEFQSLTRDCTGWSESTHVKMPHCWKSHAMAHLGGNVCEIF